MKATSLFMLLSLLVTGCMPGYRIIKETDLHGIDLQLQAQNERMERMALERESLQDGQQIMLEFCSELQHQLQEISLRQEKQSRRQQELVEAVRRADLQRQKVEDELRLAKQEIPAAGEKQVIGAVEKIFLSPPGMRLSARIDTGAVTSSLDARDIEHFERNGDRWVRFTMVDPEDESEICLELELERKVRIIQAEQEEPDKRPVVNLGVTVGRHTQTAQFTLTDRRHMEYPVLIGRNILKDIMVVDVSRINIAPPRIPADASEDNDTP